MSTYLQKILFRFSYYFFTLCILLGSSEAAIGQNIACVSTLNTAGNSYQGNSLSSVFSLGEVFTGSSLANGQYAVIGIIKFDGKLTTNLKEEHKNINVEVFPNPVMDKLLITIDEDTYHYRIVNSIGQIVLKNTDTSDKYIDVSMLQTGTYLLQIALENKGYQSVSWLIKI